MRTTAKRIFLSFFVGLPRQVVSASDVGQNSDSMQDDENAAASGAPLNKEPNPPPSADKKHPKPPRWLGAGAGYMSPQLLSLEVEALSQRRPNLYLGAALGLAVHPEAASPMGSADGSVTWTYGVAIWDLWSRVRYFYFRSFNISGGGGFRYAAVDATAYESQPPPAGNNWSYKTYSVNIQGALGNHWDVGRQSTIGIDWVGYVYPLWYKETSHNRLNSAWVYQPGAPTTQYLETMVTTYSKRPQYKFGVLTFGTCF